MNKATQFKKGHKTNVGRKVSKETRIKIGLANKGNKSKLGYKTPNEVKQKISLAQIGKLHHNWTTKTPSYSSVHKWLLKYHNSKKKNCRKCGGDRFLEWALRKGKKHTHNVNNYYILCSSCHKRYDYTNERRTKLSIAHKGRKITWADKISKGRIKGIKQRSYAI